MTDDDELESRLRRLAAHDEAASAAPDWDGMAAEVLAAYERQRRPRPRRRRWRS